MAVRRLRPGPAAVLVTAVVAMVALTSGSRAVTASDPITSVAGTGTRGFSGDGGPATTAQLDGPLGIAVDAAGNLYIADAGNHRVRKVTPTGVITTAAGTGMLGFSGDAGQATAAQLYDSFGVAVDAAGSLYIADTENQRVRKVTPDGVITTVAGTGMFGFSGDGGPATMAQLSSPSDVAVDAAGNLYIADSMNHRVRKVAPGGGITTFAGTGTAGFAGDGGQSTAAQLNLPRGVAVDAVGNVYIAEQQNDRVRKVTPDGVITTVAGTGTRGYSGDGGPAIMAQLSGPFGVAVDPAGSFYIADTFNHRVRRVSPDGVITTVAGTGTAGFAGDRGPAFSAQLNRPRGVAVDRAGSLYIGDTSNHRVRKVTAPAPVAVFAAAPARGQTPLTVSLDGSGSTPGSGTIVSFGWDFGDGARASGPQTTHTYTRPGTHTVRLTVTDGEGSTGVATRVVTVAAAPGGEAAAGVAPGQPAASGACTVRGTPRRDVLRGTSGADVICGLGGNDVLRGGGGNDVLRGGTGKDVLRGGRGADVLRGGRGADVIRAGRGRDRLFGGAGADVLRGAAGRDTLAGGGGKDTLVGGRGRDVARGGSGNDTCWAERRRSC